MFLKICSHCTRSLPGTEVPLDATSLKLRLTLRPVRRQQYHCDPAEDGLTSPPAFLTPAPDTCPPPVRHTACSSRLLLCGRGAVPLPEPLPAGPFSSLARFILGPRTLPPLTVSKTIFTCLSPVPFPRMEAPREQDIFLLIQPWILGARSGGRHSVSACRDNCCHKCTGIVVGEQRCGKRERISHPRLH